MAPRSPISASVADWLVNVRRFLAYIRPDDEAARRTSEDYAPLAGTLVRIQARYGTLNARIQRETDRLALWLLAKVDLPEGVANLLVEGLSSEGQPAHATGKTPIFKDPGRVGFGLFALIAEGRELVFDDEAADNAAYDAYQRPYDAYQRPYGDFRQVRSAGGRPS